jgi:hypothetical protein
VVEPCVPRREPHLPHRPPRDGDETYDLDPGHGRTWRRRIALRKQQDRRIALFGQSDSPALPRAFIGPVEAEDGPNVAGLVGGREDEQDGAGGKKGDEEQHDGQRDPPPATLAVAGPTPLHLASYVVLDTTSVLACGADRARIRPLLCHNSNKGTGDAFACNKKGSRPYRREPFFIEPLEVRM